MPFSQATEYPKGTFSTQSLSTTAVAVDGTEATTVKIAGGVITGGAAAEIVIFRRPSAGAEYFRIGVPIGAVVPVPAFDAVGGLEILTASAAGDVNVTLTFFKG